MKKPLHGEETSNYSGRGPLWWLLGAGAVLLIIAFLMPRPRTPLADPPETVPTVNSTAAPRPTAERTVTRL